MSNVSIDGSVKRFAEPFPTPAGGTSNNVISRSYLPHTGEFSMHIHKQCSIELPTEVRTTCVLFCPFSVSDIIHEITSTRSRLAERMTAPTGARLSLILSFAKSHTIRKRFLSCYRLHMFNCTFWTQRDKITNTSKYTLIHLALYGVREHEANDDSEQVI